jgi:hypothetical protein
MQLLAALLTFILRCLNWGWERSDAEQVRQSGRFASARPVLAFRPVQCRVMLAQVVRTRLAGAHVCPDATWVPELIGRHMVRSGARLLERLT